MFTSSFMQILKYLTLSKLNWHCCLHLAFSEDEWLSWYSDFIKWLQKVFLGSMYHQTFVCGEERGIILQPHTCQTSGEHTRDRGARWKVGGLTIENIFFILKIEKRNKIIVFDLFLSRDFAYFIQYFLLFIGRHSWHLVYLAEISFTSRECQRDLVCIYV